MEATDIIINKMIPVNVTSFLFLQMSTLLQKLSNIELNFVKELGEMRCRVEKCEILGAENSKQLKRLDKKFTTELSKYHYKQEEKISYVFDAPERNPYFSGRTRELLKLEHVLKYDDTEQEKKVCIAAVCGMGGIGKTSLVTEYAHKMKNHYQGGVYWFSAEDDTFFERSVNNTALKLGALLGTFDLTMTNTLLKISQTNEPCLIVLDCLDQLNLTPNILKFLSDVSRQRISAACVLLTRRSESLLIEDVSSLAKERCLSLACLEVEEAKQFLFQRTEISADQNASNVAQKIAEELGGLPLALEQAGACIKSIGCSLADYFEQYQKEHLKLLERKKAKPASVYEAPERVAVHTTWLLNISHIKESPDGMSAIRLMNAFAFLNATEIEQELVNVGEPPIEDEVFRDCLSSHFGCLTVVKLLTDFSLFKYVHAHSVSTHRLVQELVRENLDAEGKAKSFADAVRLLSFAFSNCTSPKSLLGSGNAEERWKRFELPKNSSDYYLWSKLCFHGFCLQQRMEKLLENLEQKCLDSLFAFETAKIFYECVVHLSANQKQFEAKHTLNFAYRILDWVALSNYDTVERSLLDRSLSPPVVPLPKWLQIGIRQCCVPPMSSLEALNEKPRVVTEGPYLQELKEKVEKLRLEGNKNFKDGLYQEAVEAYSAAIDMSKDTPAFDALLFTNRASAYIKLNQCDAALKDANEYILRFPDCWKGYARKALALDEKVSTEIAAALSYYYFRLEGGGCIFSEYQPFIGSFPGLKERIYICDTVSQLTAALISCNAQDCLRVIILGSKEYNLNSSSMFRFMPLAGLHDASKSFAISMRNIILIGAKSDGSVIIKFEENMGFNLLEKCMCANLTFLIDNGQILSSPKSWVKILKCNFSSNKAFSAAVGAQGVFHAERCNFTNCKGGGLLCVGPGEMVVDNCTFARNVKAGLEVRENGKLTVRNSRMYYNGLDGLLIGPRTEKCDAFDCYIYHNDREGIAALDALKQIKLTRNHVYGNDENGIFVKNSEVDMRENKFFDNEAWGIWSQSNSWCNVSMNEVFRNKLGGVRVGKRLAEKSFRSSIVELNTIHDNYGPGYIENLNAFEDTRLLFNDGNVSKVGDDYKSAQFAQNIVYKNEELTIVNESKYLSSWCSRCFGKREELKMCGKCFTAAYCNADCQRSHWSKHKKLCKILREKSSFLITSIKKRLPDRVAYNFHARGLDEVGPKYSSPPPRDGKRFIVKLQTNFDASFDEPHTLGIYDRSLEVHESFQSEFIYRLVKNFGILAQRKYQEKKLFLYCVFEIDGKLRLFINDFAGFKSW